MEHADEVLADEEIVAIVYGALGKRHPNSRCRGRRGTPAEVVLRLLTLKYPQPELRRAGTREVRANLVYRDFTRVGGGKMPDAKTMGRWGVALGPQVIAQIYERMVAIAKEKGVVKASLAPRKSTRRNTAEPPASWDLPVVFTGRVRLTFDL
jgi:transposase, IS5 family